MEIFDHMPRLGQFGILDLADHYYPGRKAMDAYGNEPHVVNRYYPNVGGNHITRKVLWDLGARQVENTWAQGAHGNEDVLFSQTVGSHGYFYAHFIYPLATHLGQYSGHYGNRRYREYYRRTYKERLGRDIYPDIPPNGPEF